MACVAAAMLLFEVVVTRTFSILFFYHYSFFAITLVMAGFVLGGIVAARWDAPRLDAAVFDRRLARLAALFAFGMAAAVLALVGLARPDIRNTPSPWAVAGYALLFLPGLVAAGAFLALAFARDKAFIGTLYAFDLVAAAGACLASIVLLRALQGPAVLLCPVLLAGSAAVLLGARSRWRLVGGVLVGLTLALVLGDRLVAGRLLRLRATMGGAPAPLPMLERWNEHSRVQAFEKSWGARYLVIDRSAATVMWPAPPRPDGKPIDPNPSWTDGVQYQVYHLGRSLRRVAVIGVGGGQDVLAAIGSGAERIDGYELNAIFIELLERTFRDYNALVTRPEVHLIHDEARVGITHSNAEYDVIQASLIDTWAATASGGFVLSENNLYTREAWHTFLTHLSDRGVLTMSRWLIPEAPAETYRLVALAAASLADYGLVDAASRILLVGPAETASLKAYTASEGRPATILVSKSPFTPAEVARVEASCAAQGLRLMLAPGRPPSDPGLFALLGAASRQTAIRTSRFDIAPPRDTRPYFFLQVRPSDLVNLSRKNFGFITEITFNGVRIVVILGLCALALVLAVALLTAFTLPGAATTLAQRRDYRLMLVYFLGIGLGYIFVQVGLHQRLVIVLGHPTLALSVVLFSMLLGTGLGAAASARLFASERTLLPGAVILVTLSALYLGLPLAPELERIHAAGLRIGLVVLILGLTGFVLGFAFPLGVRRVAPTGEWAVQKMWAVNGAASVAASVLAALVGLALGTPAVLATAIAAYGFAFTAAALTESSARPSGGAATIDRSSSQDSSSNAGVL